MKFIPQLAFALALLACTSAQAAPRLLSEFRGVYRGSVSMKLDGHVYYGPARIEVTTQRRTATFKISGHVVVLRRSMALSNQLVFQRSGSVVERSITNGFAGRKIGARGSYAAVSKRLSFRAPYSSAGMSGTTSGSASIEQKGRKQWLNLQTSVTTSDGKRDYLFNFKVWNYNEP